MARVNVIDPETRELVGWFDDEKAVKYAEAQYWNGSNWISVATGNEWNHEDLYRTASGRWVLCRWSQWHRSLDTYEFVSDEQAREWLIKNGHYEDAERFFGRIKEERVPERPEIGPIVQMRLPDDLLRRVDNYARTESISRAEAIRRLLEYALERQVR